MPAATDCPGLLQYRRLVSGELSAPEVEALLGHLEGCASCVREVAAVAEQDTLAELVRQSSALGEGASTRGLTLLIQRLRKQHPGPGPSGDQAEALPPRGAPPARSFSVRCPYCQNPLKVKAELAGKRATCPQCHRPFQVPGPLPGAGGPGAPPAWPSTLAPRPGQATAEYEGGLPPDQPGEGRELLDFLAPAQAPDELGRLGPYRVLKVLGAGGMGVVYKAEDPQLKRLVALKAMLPRLAASTEARQRFLREARAAAAIVHDHVVAVHQVGEDRGVPFLAMQLLEGEPLDERLKREGKLPMAEALRLGREVALGLAAAHKRGLVHRDIKPANVWLEAETGRVKVLDFGLARAAGEGGRLTQTGAIVGTPAYMAPEQAQGKDLDGRCDLFSLGCLLYRMTTGQPAFQGTDLISTLMAVATAGPPPPRELDASVPPELSDLILRLLAKEPADRPPSALAVVEAIEKIEAATGASAVRTGRGPRGAERPGQTSAEGTPAQPGPHAGKWRPWLWLAAGAAGCGLVLAAVLLFWRTPHGLVRIESDDPNVEIVFDKTGPTIKGIGEKPISLRAGEHTILVKRGDFTFGTDKLVIEKGKTVTLKIELLPGKMRLLRDGKEVAAGDVPLPKHFTNKLGMELVLVPRGRSWLGGGGGIPGKQKVEVPYDFYLGKYEVTQGEWEKVMGNNPSRFRAEPAAGITNQKRLPVEQVSWDDAQEFIKGLHDETEERGWRYRLPTEVEWEYACRGGPLANRKQSAFHFYFAEPTNTLRPGQACFFHGQQSLRTCEVGSYRPNPLGLYDMHGNVMEWCDDARKWGDKAPFRAVRGGCYSADPGGCQAASPSQAGQALRDCHFGFRLARVPIGKDGK